MTRNYQLVYIMSRKCGNYTEIRRIQKYCYGNWYLPVSSISFSKSILNSFSLSSISICSCFICTSLTVRSAWAWGLMKGLPDGLLSSGRSNFSIWSHIKGTKNYNLEFVSSNCQGFLKLKNQPYFFYQNLPKSRMFVPAWNSLE